MTRVNAVRRPACPFPSLWPRADIACESDGGPGCGTLVGVSALSAPEAWLTLPDIAERLGIPVTAVRQLLEDRELLASRRGERGVLRVPAAFLDDEGVHPALKGTFTVLADAGMDDDEIIDWLYEPDPTLPVPGGPIDSIRAGFKTEVRRRAMESAF